MEGLIASFLRFVDVKMVTPSFEYFQMHQLPGHLNLLFDFFQGLYEYSLSSNEDILYSKACKKSSWEKFNLQIISYSII